LRHFEVGDTYPSKFRLVFSVGYYEVWVKSPDSSDVRDEEVFVIRRNENFINNIIVGCYILKDDIDRLAYLGVVHLVQDKVIQIKIRYDFKVLGTIPESIDALKNISVRPVVPVTALQQLINMEDANG